jgi:oligoendopeptidase F
VAEVIERQTSGAESVEWDLSIFYQGADDPALQADMESLHQEADSFAARYRGKIAVLPAPELTAALTEFEKLVDRIGRITSFTNLLYTTDTNNPRYSGLYQKSREFASAVQQKLLFVTLEWNQADEAHVKAILSDSTVSTYRHFLEAQRRFQPYQLSEIEEQLLLEKGVTGKQSWVRLFTELMSALRFPFNDKPMIQSEIFALLHHADRDIRRQVANTITEVLRGRAMELTFIFNTIVADKASEDKRRGYPSWISPRNLDNKASDATVNALVTAVTANYDLVSRHYALKRKLFGYDTLYDYDRYAPLPIEASDRVYHWDEAREIVSSAYHAFSPQAGDVVDRFFNENWIHAAPAPGKRGGAFSSSTVPSAHPFILMSFTGRGRDLMTLAHELGHGIHQFLTAQANGALNTNTPLTTSEMASVFGEMLVFTDRMRTESNPAARLSLLAHKIEDTFSTVFRQISMNRFEDALHTARRTEGELTTARISELWMQTQHAMYGDSVTLRDEYSQWWSYIPHFLRTPGYVYAYAFGELLVLALFRLYQQRGEEFVPQYLEVLAAGDSDYPEHILAKLGVDLNDPAFWNEGLAALRAMVEQEEQLAREVFPEKF